MAIVSGLGRQRQEDFELETSLSYIETSRTVWAA
jgi:hypothetical protein